MKVRNQGFRGMGREIAGRVFRGRIPLNPAVWSRIKYAITGAVASFCQIVCYVELRFIVL